MTVLDLQKHMTLIGYLQHRIDYLQQSHALTEESKYMLSQHWYNLYYDVRSVEWTLRSTIAILLGMHLHYCSKQYDETLNRIAKLLHYCQSRLRTLHWHDSNRNANSTGKLYISDEQYMQDLHDLATKAKAIKHDEVYAVRAGDKLSKF